MNFIHTLWTKPLLNSNKSDKEIVDSIRITLLDYTYSMRLVQAFGHTITLYTDIDGLSILEPLPYDNIVIVKIPDDEDIRFAALIKFKALLLCNLEDFIIDGDILLQKKGIYDRLLELSKVNDCLYSIIENLGPIEKANPGYGILINGINNSNLLPGYIYDDTDVIYPNTSILFIKDSNLRKEYINLYYYHKGILKDKLLGNLWPDFIVELYFLLKTLDNKDIYTHRPIVYNYELSNELNELGFAHLGGSKKLANLLIAMGLFKLDLKLFNIINQHMEYLSKKYVH